MRYVAVQSSGLYVDVGDGSPLLSKPRLSYSNSSRRDVIFSNTIRRGVAIKAYLRNGWARIELYGGLGGSQIQSQRGFTEKQIL